jgi:hypothetical protein
MNWTELLLAQMEDAYRVTDRLMGLLSDEDLDWRPATGTNWMSNGQLLLHLVSACGYCCNGFVTGEWGLPTGYEPGDLPTDGSMPTADQIPAVESVAAARELLAADRKTALAIVNEVGEERLAGEQVGAPWDPENKKTLGLHLLNMVEHLNSHKMQLFFYLKSMDKGVNTMHLWGP